MTTPEDEYIELIRTELVKVAYHAKQIEKCMDKIYQLSETHYDPEASDYGRENVDQRGGDWEIVPPDEKGTR